MMKIVLTDRAAWRQSLHPLTLTRPVSDLRVGIMTIAEKWKAYLDVPYTYITSSYLANKFPFDLAESDDFLLIRGNCCPDERLVETARSLRQGAGLVDALGLLMVRLDRQEMIAYARNDSESIAHNSHWDLRNYTHSLTQVIYPEDIFLQNGDQISSDFEVLTQGRTSAPLSGTNQLLGDQIFAEEGVQVECSILNSLKGPIYLGRNSEIWENCAVRGPFALGEASQLKMGAKVYSNVSIGPYSRVGGEMNTCVIQGYSSKGHDGYLGSAVMGEWCNWGADTNNSNLKNNYKPVKVYDYPSGQFRKTGLQFYGLIMGDHAKCAINTAFNTGSVVGVGASVFGAGFPPTFVPDFSWGGAEGFEEYDLERMLESAALVYARRNVAFTEEDAQILRHVFRMTADKRANYHKSM